MFGGPGTKATFACSFDPGVPEALAELECSIAISTYQAGKLIFISPNGKGGLVQLTRTFQKPMGFAISNDRLVLACEKEVLQFSNSRSLAQHFPRRPGWYDALYMPRATYHTGALDLHDVSIGGTGTIHAVNTAFNCIVQITSDYSFIPIWKPPFTVQLQGDDQCHLNGMAMSDGVPRFATAFGTGNKPKSWRDTIPGSGVLMDVQNDEILLEGLGMPHSPRLFHGRLFLLLSATGQVLEVDVTDGSVQEIVRLDGFVRGMAIYRDHMFVGRSALRNASSSFERLNLKEAIPFAAISIIDLRSGRVVGNISYQDSVEEIYDVQVLPGILRPNIMNTIGDEHRKGITTPDRTFWSSDPPEPKPRP
ncbi:MAG: TIGR03032 family protein [Flavobacteriales bacterium]|nr:TIGR03032 family protein [Flavobacteriales bacterium]